MLVENLQRVLRKTPCQKRQGQIVSRIDVLRIKIERDAKLRKRLLKPALLLERNPVRIVEAGISRIHGWRLRL
jgi:hypothetical protein